MEYLYFRVGIRFSYLMTHLDDVSLLWSGLNIKKVSRGVIKRRQECYQKLNRRCDYGKSKIKKKRGKTRMENTKTFTS